MQILTPHVYWAQRHGEIYLRVELSDAKVGQHPTTVAAFSLNCHRPVVYCSSNVLKWL